MLVWDNISYKNSIKSKQAMATALGTEFSSVVLFTITLIFQKLTIIKIDLYLRSQPNYNCWISEISCRLDLWFLHTIVGAGSSHTSKIVRCVKITQRKVSLCPKSKLRYRNKFNKIALIVIASPWVFLIDCLESNFQASRVRVYRSEYYCFQLLYTIDVVWTIMACTSKYKRKGRWWFRYKEKSSYPIPTNVYMPRMSGQCPIQDIKHISYLAVSRTLT